MILCYDSKRIHLCRVNQDPGVLPGQRESVAGVIISLESRPPTRKHSGRLLVSGQTAVCAHVKGTALYQEGEAEKD